MGDIKVYGLDSIGVVVDTNVIGNPDGTLTKAQNAVADPIGEAGSIRKRPGLKPFNSTAASASVLGAVSVPIQIGSAGPMLTNPFTNVSVAATDLLTPVYSLSTIPNGALFDDESWVTTFAGGLDLAGDFDFTDIEKLLELIAKLLAELALLDDEEAKFRARVRIDALQQLVDALDAPDALLRFDPDANTLDMTDGSSTGTTTIPLTFIGTTATPSWALILNHTASEHIKSDTTLPANLRMLPFPSQVREQGIGGFAIMNAANSVNLSQRAACVLNNKLYYAAAGHTTGSSSGPTPTIRCYDGFTDTEVLSMPNVYTDVFAVQIVNQILVMTAHDGVIYFSTHDGGVAAGVSSFGSVWQFVIQTGELSRLGPQFSTDQTPFSLCWTNGKLWAGTVSNGSSALLYSIFPGDAAWVLEHTFNAGIFCVSGITPFQGNLYLSTYNRTMTGNIECWVRAVDATYSVADAATLDTNATHVCNRGYTLPVVWPPEDSGITSPAPALYVARLGSSDDGNNVIVIRRLTAAGVWSTVQTFGTGVGSTYLQPSSTFSASAGGIIPALWLATATTTWNTIDGTTWVDRSANCSLAGANCCMFPGFTIQA